MKFEEILKENRGLSEALQRELNISRTVINNLRDPNVKSNFTNKKNVYEVLLDYKLINPDETTITELFK